MDNNELFRRVNDLMQQERWADAIAAAGIVDENANAELVWLVGWAQFQLGRYNDAVSYLQRAVDTGTVDPAKYGALGMAFLRLKQYGDAELWLLRSIVVRDTSLSRLGLAVAYEEQGLAEEAEAVHKEGLRLRPNDAKRHEQYADFLSDARREDEAGAMYERAAELRKAGEAE